MKTKCSPDAMCIEQAAHDKTYGKYNIVDDCCGYCREDLRAIFFDLPEDLVELSEADWEVLNNAPVEPTEALIKLLKN